MLRSRWRVLIIAVLASAIFVGGTGIASAAAPVDDSSYSEAKKAAAEQTAAADTAKRTCELFVKGLFATKLQPPCVEAMQSKFTREAVPVLAGTALCGAMTGTMVALKVVCVAVVASQAETIKGWFWDSYEAALGAAETVVAAVAFVANPARALDFFLNDLKDGAIGMFTGAMTYVTQLTSFDAGAPWWRTAYAATAGIGLAVLAFMLLLTMWQSASGRIDSSEAARTLLGYAPVAVLMMVMGPPVAWGIAYVADGMSAGIISWMGPDVVDFLAKAGSFSGLTAHMTGGIGMGLLLFGLLFLASLGVIGTFLVQTISVYILGAVVGIAWGMAGNPRWRAKALRLPAVWVGLVLAKPAMLLVLGLVVKMANAINMTPDTIDAGMKSLVDALLVVLALIFIAFAPWTLLKWFPLLPDGSESVNSSGPVAAGAAMGAAGSTMTTMAMTRARGASNNSGGGGGGASGQVATANRNPAPATSGGASSAGSPATRAATSNAGAGKAAASGGKVAAGAGAGAASGGALLAAQLAAQAGQAAMSKAREAASSAAPDIKGGGDR